MTRDSALGSRCHKALFVSEARRALEIISEYIYIYRYRYIDIDV